MSLVSELLDFVLSLLGDDEAATQFLANPGGALHAAGLTGVRVAHVDTIRPVVLDVCMLRDAPAAWGEPVSLTGAGGRVASPERRQAVDQLIHLVQTYVDAPPHRDGPAAGGPTIWQDSELIAAFDPPCSRAAATPADGEQATLPRSRRDDCDDPDTPPGSRSTPPP